MKKLTALILTLVMLVSMTAIVPVSAETLPMTTAENYDVVPGQTFDVNWVADGDHNFNIIQWTVEYDTSAFTFDDTAAIVLPESETDDESVVSKNADSSGLNYLFMRFNEEGYTTVSDNGTVFGVTFTVAENAEPGVYTFTNVADLLIYDDGDGYLDNTMDSTSTFTVTVKGEEDEIIVDSDNLTSDAYQIRVPHSGAEETTFGFRFISEVDVTNYTNVKSYGTLVIPAAKLTGDLTVDTADVENVVAAKFMEGTKETFKQFNATMVDIKDANYAIDFTYRPYIVLEDDSIVYGEVATANIINTIKGLYNDLNDEQKAFVEALPGYNA